MKKFFFPMVLAAVAFGLSSCNTFIGMGKDIESLGSGMQSSAYKQSGTTPPPAETHEQAQSR